LSSNSKIIPRKLFAKDQTPCAVATTRIQPEPDANSKTADSAKSYRSSKVEFSSSNLKNKI